MTPSKRVHLSLALAAASLVATTAHATSSAVVSASDGLSTSSDASSMSSRHSSRSSSRPLAMGDYRVTRVADAGEAGRKEVTFVALDARAGTEGEQTFSLPDAAIAKGALAPGRVVSARERPYGVELARADTRTAFFLLLADDWQRDLKTVAVTL